MSDTIFCIPCKYLKNKSYILDCVSNLRKYHPDDDILVIDSFSEDDSYLKVLKENYSIIEDNFKNSHWIDGVIWYTYKNYKRKKYCFIHDSLIIGKNIDNYIKYDLTVYGYFRSCFMPYSDDLHAKGIIGLESDQDSLNWISENLKKINIESIPYFDGVFGEMFNISREILEYIYITGWPNVFLPNNKKQGEQMERMWGMIFKILGFDIKEHSILGDYMNYNINIKGDIWKNNGITKLYGKRQ